MYTGLIYVELLKYRRSMIPWLIGLGGLLPAGSALLTVSNSKLPVGWETLTVTGMNYFNLLALLLVSVFSGHVYAEEYHVNTAGTIFTYPVPRYAIFICKFISITVFVLFQYLFFALSTVLLGLSYIGNVPTAEFINEAVKVLFMLWAFNLALVPVTAFISIMVKGIGAYLLAGMGYIIVYMSLMNSNYSRFIPVCFPDKLVTNYLVSECLSKDDFNTIILVSAAVFIAAFTAGAIYYSKYDVYK